MTSNTNTNTDTIMGAFDATAVASAYNYGGRGRESARWATLLPVDLLPDVMAAEGCLAILTSRGIAVQLVTDVAPMFDGEPIGTMYRDGAAVEVVALNTEVVDLPRVSYSKTAPKSEDAKSEVGAKSLSDVLDVIGSKSAPKTTRKPRTAAKSTGPRIPAGTDTAALVKSLRK
jgi:hypothetical protein